jgi:hypothetical protein
LSAPITRYHALLKVCDLACAHAAATGADRTPDFWDTISAALVDDCPDQSRAAHRIARDLSSADRAKVHFFKLIPGPIGPEPKTDPAQSTDGDGDGSSLS